MGLSEQPRLENLHRRRRRAKAEAKLTRRRRVVEEEAQIICCCRGVASSLCCFLQQAAASNRTRPECSWGATRERGGGAGAAAAFRAYRLPQGDAPFDVHGPEQGVLRNSQRHLHERRRLPDAEAGRSSGRAAASACSMLLLLQQQLVSEAVLPLARVARVGVAVRLRDNLDWRK